MGHAVRREPRLLARITHGPEGWAHVIASPHRAGPTLAEKSRCVPLGVKEGEQKSCQRDLSLRLASLSGSDICIALAAIYVSLWQRYMYSSGSDICIALAAIYVSLWQRYMYRSGSDICIALAAFYVSLWQRYMYRSGSDICIALAAIHLSLW